MNNKTAFCSIPPGEFPGFSFTCEYTISINTRPPGTNPYKSKPPGQKPIAKPPGQKPNINSDIIATVDPRIDTHIQKTLTVTVNPRIDTKSSDKDHAKDPCFQANNPLLTTHGGKPKVMSLDRKLLVTHGEKPKLSTNNTKGTIPKISPLNLHPSNGLLFG